MDTHWCARAHTIKNKQHEGRSINTISLYTWRRKRSPVPGDVIKDAISRLLIRHPLANEHARRRGSQLSTSEETMAVAHIILKAAFKHFTGGVAVVEGAKR